MPPPSFMQEHLLQSIDDGLAEHEREHIFRLRFGRGNWRYFHVLDYKLEDLLAEAERWGKSLAGVERPWLCWNISHDWCLVQQQLVKRIGWTPVVGYDPRVGPPIDTVEDAIVLDFNERLQLPVLQMQVVIDLAFLLAPRLAFWHSDLLCRDATMRRLDRWFRELDDGALAICEPQRNVWQRLTGYRRRYFELVGCITRGAARRNFETGCGLWRAFAFHPNCPDADEFAARRQLYWDHGSGIKYWQERLNGRVQVIRPSLVEEGHFSRTNMKNFVARSNKDGKHAGLDLESNVSLERACTNLGIRDVWNDTQRIKRTE
jgi:hypothetical protein